MNVKTNKQINNIIRRGGNEKANLLVILETKLFSQSIKKASKVGNQVTYKFTLIRIRTNKYFSQCLGST